MKTEQNGARGGRLRRYNTWESIAQGRRKGGWLPQNILGQTSLLPNRFASISPLGPHLAQAAAIPQ